MDKQLQQGIQKNDFSMVKEAIESGANIHIFGGISSDMPIINAVLSGNYQISEYLIENGANVDRALSLAMLHKELHYYVYSIEKVIRGDKRENFLSLALDGAICRSHTEVIDKVAPLLKEYHDIREGFYMTRAVIKDQYDALICLDKYGYQFDSYSGYEFKQAVKSDSPNIIKFFIEKDIGYKMDSKLIRDFVEHYSLNCLEMALKDYKINKKDLNYVFRWMARKGDFYTAYLAYEKGADIKGRNFEALKWSKDNDSDKFVEFFLDNINFQTLTEKETKRLFELLEPSYYPKLKRNIMTATIHESGANYSEELSL